MSLRLRLAAAMAFVALLTWLAVAIAAPSIVGRGFSRLQGDGVSPGGGGPGSGQAAGASPGATAGSHYLQVQQDTTTSILVVALAAGAGSTLLGILIAGRIVAPIRRLQAAAGAVAAGDLAHRSGVGARRDEIGALGRSFDSMAAELERADESRRRFLADAAHELKTPLAVIEATSTAVLEGVYPHDREHLETILQQSQILSRLVSDLRTISLAESGSLPLRRERLDVTDLVATVRRSFTARATAAGIELTSEVADGLMVDADRDRLAQVLGALLDNAIRHTPSGSISLVASAVSERVRIDVADTGPGIPEAAIGHVFDRFYQADESRDRSSGTSGLGLSIAKAIIDAHGGTIEAANLPGRGARFRIELAAAQARLHRADAGGPS
jgi:two-component system, OmpR family, sensor histidine kinase BaeS